MKRRNHSSDNQREESIKGQIRECKAFAEKNDIEIIETYIDRRYPPKRTIDLIFSDSSRTV